MPYGYTGRVARVDLTTGRVWEERPDDLTYRYTMGGACLAAGYLLRELAPEVDALAPGNLLIFATGIPTGAPAPGFDRHTVMAKSPLSGGIAESQSGGFWGAELKVAGFDALIVQGRAERPMYLWVTDGKIEVRDASGAWGREVAEAQRWLLADAGDEQARVAAIGPAGERLVRYACIVNDGLWVNGRTGVGAVMGSKRLKAVLVRGSGSVEVADAETVSRISAYVDEHILENPVNRVTYEQGMAGAVHNLSSLIAAKNLRITGWEGTAAIDGQRLMERWGGERVPGHASPVAGKKRLRGTEAIGANPFYGEPEMESLTGLGCQPLVADPDVMVRAHAYCNAQGMDVTSAGFVVAFAMECFERGMLTREQAGDLDLRWGNGEALMRMLELIARREGIGDLLAEGVKRASEKLGAGTEAVAMHSKGVEMIPHDPRVKAMLGVACAVSPIGPDILAVEHDTDFDFAAPQIYLDQVTALGIHERLDPRSLSPAKMRMLARLQPVFSFMDALCVDAFAFAPVRFLPFGRMVELISAIAGWETSLYELEQLGKRRLAMLRIFNLRHGLSAADDRLPDRVFGPLATPAGPVPGLDRDEFERAVKTYYALMGWDERGIPTDATLTDLNLEWLIEVVQEARR